MVPLGLLAGGGASSLFCTTVLKDNRREKTRGERKSSTLRDREAAAAELDASAAAPCATTPGQPVPPREKHPWAGVGERACCPARREAGSGQSFSTHLFVLGSWWEAGGGMSEVLQCPLQG